MSISSAQSLKRSDHYISSENYTSLSNDFEEKNLKNLIHQKSFSSITEKLQKLLKHYGANKEGTLKQSLLHNIALLQEGFLDTLYSLLDSEDIDVSHKITLRLDTKGNLLLYDEHPNIKTIENIFIRYPELSAAFFEIAVQSTVVNTLSKLDELVHNGYCTKNSPAYRLTLKGDMNHFYFYS